MKKVSLPHVCRGGIASGGGKGSLNRKSPGGNVNLQGENAELSVERGIKGGETNPFMFQGCD